MPHIPPQPAVDRLTPFGSSAIVVGISPTLPDLIVATACSLAAAIGSPYIYFAYADASRYVVKEYDDGTVRHESLSSDSLDDGWKSREERFVRKLGTMMKGSEVPWEFRYLAGRPDRALTHLARAVDAAVIVVGTRAPGARAHMREIVEGSVAYHLAQHQHRPVLTVPLSVVDWKATTSVWDQ